MKLYEIDAAIMECVDEETGDIVDVDRLNALEMERDAKISNLACWVKSLRAEAKAIKEEKQTLADRQKALENKADSVEKYLQGYLNGAPYSDARCKISYRHSTATEFTGDVDKLDDKYCTIKRTASLTAIKDALMSGVKIEGARLTEKDNIQIK